MKTILKISTLVLGVVLVSFTPNQQNTVSTEKSNSIIKKAAITWKSSEIELGEIPQSKPVIINFEFTNTGELPVMINSVQASCGCTSTNYAKTPVLPGESTKITATYNAAAKGAFKKTVNVITNAEDGPKTLVFTGTVI